MTPGSLLGSLLFLRTSLSHEFVKPIHHTSFFKRFSVNELLLNHSVENVQLGIVQKERKLELSQEHLSPFFTASESELCGNESDFKGGVLK